MGVAHNQNIVRSGMIFCVDAQSKMCYPGSGSTVTNIANSAGRMRYLVAGQRTSTLPSGVTWTAGPPASFVFDGTSNAYMNWGTGADWFNNETSNSGGGRWDLTFEAWVKSSGMGSGMTLGGIFGWTYGVRIHFSTNGAINVGHDVGYNILGFSAGTGFQDGVWHHIVYTFGACGARVYVDGVLKNTDTTMRWLGETRWSSNTCSLGRDQNDIYYYLNGSIAVARIYHKFFTQGHVTQNFNADRKRFGV
jgi:hypothetical protein